MSVKFTVKAITEVVGMIPTSNMKIVIETDFTTSIISTEPLSSTKWKKLLEELQEGKKGTFSGERRCCDRRASQPHWEFCSDGQDLTLSYIISGDYCDIKIPRETGVALLEKIISITESCHEAEECLRY